jgi:DNA polymerase-3 subunit alpha (Gram-positive type)
VAIGGLGETAAHDIVANRAGQKFISIEEFSMSCPKVSKTHIEQMKNLGALAGLPETSQLTLF